MDRAVKLRLAALGILGLGAALLSAAILLPTYTVSKLAKIPLDIDTTLVSTGSGKAIDPASLQAKPPPPPGAPPPPTTGIVVDDIKDGELVLQQQVTVEQPSNEKLVTLQVGTTLRRTDIPTDEKQSAAGLLLAMIDKVTLNRATAMAADIDNNGFLQKPPTLKLPLPQDRPPTLEDTQPGLDEPLPHQSLSHRFPFNVEKKSYEYFDPIAQKAFYADFDGEEDILGLSTYHFAQKVGMDDKGELTSPIKYPSLYDSKDESIITAKASEWGVEGPPDQLITMQRYYAAYRDLWVDPVTGTIVKTKERAVHYYVRCENDTCTPAPNPQTKDVTVVDYTVESTSETVEGQVNTARDQRDQLALWGRILPITFAATGIIALVAGALLGAFSLRAEDALIDPGLDSPEPEFFGAGEPPAEPVPGAEAHTEVLPTQRPDAPPGAPPP